MRIFLLKVNNIPPSRIIFHLAAPRRIMLFSPRAVNSSYLTKDHTLSAHYHIQKWAHSKNKYFFIQNKPFNIILFVDDDPNGSELQLFPIWESRLKPQVQASKFNITFSSQIKKWAYKSPHSGGSFTNDTKYECNKITIRTRKIFSIYQSNLNSYSICILMSKALLSIY